MRGGGNKERFWGANRMQRSKHCQDLPHPFNRIAEKMSDWIESQLYSKLLHHYLGEAGRNLINNFQSREITLA